MATDSASKAIELQGVMTALHVLRVLTPELQAIAAGLDQKIAQFPSLFADAPVVIDLRALEPEAIGTRPLGPRLRLLPLVDLLKSRGLAPVAIRGGVAGRVEEARSVGLGIFEWDRTGPAKKAPRTAAAQAEASPAAAAATEVQAQALETATSLTLSQPLRAGQIVYAEGCDAVALAAVNTGGELIADGNIHVYAPLRGRALAGARGNDQARIFCQRLEAELVSIAGVYLSADELPSDKLGKAVQILLRDNQLVISELNAR
jgi:septum site-determining protein MinC